MGPLYLVFNKPLNALFERYKILNRKQRGRDSFKQLWVALTDLASTCNIRESDVAERIRDFFCNLRNSVTQRQLLTEAISPSEALSQTLTDKKGYFNHQKLTNMAKLTKSQHRK